MAAPAAAIQPLAWYSELNRGHWHVLTASFLGWIFDGYEAYALLLVMTPALRQLLDPAELPDLPRYAGIRSEEHTSELQSQSNLVCRLLLEKKKNAHTEP